MATHSIILAWRIPWTKDPGRLQSIESQRVRHYWSNLAPIRWLIFFSWSSKVSVSSWVIPQRLGRIPVLPSYHKFWTQIYPLPPITWTGSHSRISWNNYECQSLIDLVLIPLPSLLGLHTLPTHNLRFLSHN